MIVHKPYKDLALIIENLYQKHGFKFLELMNEAESMEYDACTFKLNGKKIKFRSAKITPTKIGQFVTLWKRNIDGITQPQEHTDPIDLVIISTRKNKNFGQFIFPKEVLVKQSIFSTQEKEGKRGFRVYPPWDLAENAQAKKTQAWQLEYYLDLTDFNSINFNLMPH